MVNRICALLAAWLALSCNVIQAASLEATVSATSVVDGESVALYLEGTDLTETPDVSALYPLFDILDSRTSEQVSIINGARTNKNIWRFEQIGRAHV